MPITTISTSRRATVTSLLAAAFLLTAAGCAETPPGASNTSNALLTVTMTVDGVIDPNCYYFVLFNPTPTSSPSTGPIPALAEPWGGNGFATGSFTAFLECNPTQGNGTGYGMWAALNNSTNVTTASFGPAAVPIQFTTWSTSTQIQFEIPLSEIPGATSNAYLSINFIATNSLPTAQESGNTTKLYDALGDGRMVSQINSFITVPATQAEGYNNNTGLEPKGDVMEVGDGLGDGVNVQDGTTSGPDNTPVSDVDIINWSVQVTPE